MFVHPQKLILKTCGTTTLLHAVTEILKIANDYCGYQEVDAFFYSRKNFMFPEKQVWPHGDWNEEVRIPRTLKLTPFPLKGLERS